MRAWLTTLAELLGVATLCYGLSLVSLAASLTVAGAFVVVACELRG